MPDSAAEPVSTSVRSAAIAMACGIATASIGALVLAGGWLDAAALKSVIPGVISMKANTAFAFILAGAALALLSGKSTSPLLVRAGRVLALLVAFVGAATLGEFLFGWQLGIDELLFRDAPNVAATLIPGRMAPTSAVGFLLLGFALLAIEWEPRQPFRPAELLALVAAFVSLIHLAEYAVAHPILYGFDEHTRMAWQGAAVFLVLSAGVLLARPAQGVIGAIRAGRLSLRARLMGLVILASAPLLGYMVYSATDRHEETIRMARADLQDLSRQVKERLLQAVRAGEHLLYALSQSPVVVNAEPAECERVFATLLSKDMRYTSFFVADAEGRARCHSVGLLAPISYADRAYFRQVRETRRFFAGDPIIGRTTGKPLLSLAQPLLDAQGEFRGALATALDLNWFGRQFDQSRPDLNIIFTIWGEEGTILYRYPDGDKWIGKRFPDAAITRAVLSRRGDEIAVEASGITGVDTLYAVTGMENVLGSRLAISVGASKAELLAESDRVFAKSLAYFGIVFVLALAAAWGVAEYAIRRRVVALVKVSDRLAAGDLKARSGLAPGADELGQLAGSFDRMAAAMQHQVEEIRLNAEELVRTNRALRMLSECNQALVRAGDEPQLLQAICDRVVRFGDYRFAWVGYADDDAAKSVRPAARAGAGPESLEALRVTWADEPGGQGPTGSAIRTGDVFIADDIANDKRVAPWRDMALAQGYASCIGLPLMVEDHCIGALTICAAERGAFHEEELPLLRELAADLAYGIGALRDRGRRERAEERLHAAAASSLDAFYVLESVRTGAGAIADFVFRYVNDPGGRLVSMSARHMIGQRLCELLPINRTGGFFARYVRVVETGEPLNEEFPIADPAIGAGWLHHQVVRAGDGIAITSRDITERKRAEEEIRALNEGLERRVAERTRELEEASRAKSDFLANMSHELRTPLNAIIGFSEMLKDGVLGELEAKQRGFVGDIFDAGTHLLALINDILDLSKVEAGMMRLEADAVEVRALLQASLLIVKEKASAHRIRLAADLDPALGTAFADGRKLKQIVYNLLANAVKFTPDGGAVTLRARICARDGVAPDPAMPGRLIPLPAVAAGEFLEIAVEDTGIGIAEHDLGRLYQPFVQIDSATARRAGGTGLGLAMVRRLAELHGGTVAVASRPGVGSRFSVWLPYRVFADAPPPAFAPAAPERAAPAGRPLALVIEDDDHAAGLIEAQLLNEGYDTMRAATAEEGLARAAKRKPDLITLDIFLPAMDGWEFLRRLKAHPALSDVPVVIMTVAEDAERGLALGARRVLQKPFTHEQLVETLAGLVAPRADGEAPCVLVVDDNVKAVELVATALQAQGCRVLRAYGGAEAIAAARRAPPDLVILDLMMPEVNGFEVARALRESPSTACIPILVLTAKDLTAEDRARLNGAATAILHKASFSRSELLAEVRRALPKSKN